VTFRPTIAPAVTRVHAVTRPRHLKFLRVDRKHGIDGQTDRRAATLNVASLGGLRNLDGPRAAVVNA